MMQCKLTTQNLGSNKIGFVRPGQVLVMCEHLFLQKLKLLGAMVN